MIYQPTDRTQISEKSLLREQYILRQTRTGDLCAGTLTEEIANEMYHWFHSLRNKIRTAEIAADPAAREELSRRMLRQVNNATFTHDRAVENGKAAWQANIEVIRQNREVR